MGFYRLCRPNVQLYRETKVCQSSSGVPRSSVNDFQVIDNLNGDLEANEGKHLVPGFENSLVK